MKWLTATVLCVLASGSIAQEQQQQETITVPIFVQCTTTDPKELLLEQFGELPFLEGEANVFVRPDMPATGDLEMYLNPEQPNSYSIIFYINGMSCLVMSGQGIAPMITGDPI